MLQSDLLQTPIEFLKGVGEKRGAVLRKEFNIQTFNDLLYYFPYRHIDKSHVYHVRDIVNDGGYILLRGTIGNIRIVGQMRAQRLTAQFTDETGSVELVWFNGIRWVQDVLKSRKEFVIFGKPTLFNNRWNITHPELIDPAQQQHRRRQRRHHAADRHAPRVPVHKTASLASVFDAGEAVSCKACNDWKTERQPKITFQNNRCQSA